MPRKKKLHRSPSPSRRLALLAVGAAVLTSAVATLISPGWFKLVRHLPGGDKTGHFLIMGTVSFLVTLAFASARIRGRRLGPLGCVLIVGAVVTVDELLQLLFPSRSFSLGDLLANWLGILSFGAAAWLVLRVGARRRKRDS
jgi:polysaccharide biosynthesis protein VpsQ